LKHLKVRTVLPATVTGAAVLLTWQLASATDVLPVTSVPSMVDTSAELGRQLAEGSFWATVAQTVRSWAVGLALATLLAIVVGLLLGSVPFLRQSCSMVIELLKPIPPVAVIPLALLLWGPSLTMALVLVTFGAFWPLLTQVLYGVAAVDPLSTDMARSYGLSRMRTLRYVLVPSVLPFIATGLRLAASIALIVDIVAELVGGAPGLGKSIIDAETSNALAQLYADVIFAGMLGLAVSLLFTSVERPFLRWHRPSGGE